MIRTSASSLPPPFPDALRVAVVQGGPSSEAEVSRVSAAGVAVALARCGHDVTRLECDRGLPARLLEGAFEVVFPVVHGAIGEDGALQGVLELLGLPYVGAAVLASALANDKVQAKMAFRAAGLPVAPDVVLRRDAGSPDIDDLQRHARAVVAELGSSLVVKPATQGSALGVTLLPRLPALDRLEDVDAALVQALERAFLLDDVVLVERFVKGREVTCGVVDLSDYEPPSALPPLEIRPKSAEWYDYRSRYGTGGSQHLCPAPLPVPLLGRVSDVAVAAHRALGIRDLSRADFVVRTATEEEPEDVVLLEVNTMPGMTPTSLFPEAAAVAGIPFESLCDRLVRRARARGVRKVNAAEPFPA